VLKVGVVLAYFGRREEALTALRRELQHSSSPKLSLQLSRTVVEVCFQMREWKDKWKHQSLL